MIHALVLRSTEQPGLIYPALRLVRPNLFGVLQREADFIKPMQQAVLAKRLDVESEARARWSSYALLLEVHGQAIARHCIDLPKQLVDRRGIEHQRKQSVLEAVVEEDIGIARRDHRAKAIVHQRPGGMLTRRAATEVLAREQDLSPRVARLMQDECGVERSLRIVHARLAAIQVAP